MMSSITRIILSFAMTIVLHAMNLGRKNIGYKKICLSVICTIILLPFILIATIASIHNDIKKESNK